jgi:hypothetical protein
MVANRLTTVKSALKALDEPWEGEVSCREVKPTVRYEGKVGHASIRI